MGLAIHPETGELWASEHAAQGGDEVNIIRPGVNYGWPVVSYSREYTGQRISERPWQEGFEQPEIVWIPSIGPSGLLFYTGDRFPAWQGDLFTGSLMTGRIERTGHLERIRFNRQGLEQRREWLPARRSLLLEPTQSFKIAHQGSNRTPRKNPAPNQFPLIENAVVERSKYIAPNTQRRRVSVVRARSLVAATVGHEGTTQENEQWRARHRFDRNTANR